MDCRSGSRRYRIIPTRRPDGMSTVPFSVRRMPSTDRAYELTVSGQVLADDWVAGIFLEAPAGGQLGCPLMAVPAPAGSSAWTQFSFATKAPPSPRAILYFLVYNQYFGGGNATGLRVEFTSAYFTPL